VSRADDLLEALAPILGVRLPDAPAVVAFLSLDEAENFLAAAGIADDWPIRVLAAALDEMRERARRQTDVDRSIGGRRHGRGFR